MAPGRHKEMPDLDAGSDEGEDAGEEGQGEGNEDFDGEEGEIGETMEVKKVRFEEGLREQEIKTNGLRG